MEEQHQSTSQHYDEALRACWRSFDITPVAELRTISVAAPDEVSDLARVAEAIQQAGVAVDEIALRRPTLDDAFLALTGHAATQGR